MGSETSVGVRGAPTSGTGVGGHGARREDRTEFSAPVPQPKNATSARSGSGFPASRNAFPRVDRLDDAHFRTMGLVCIAPFQAGLEALHDTGPAGSDRRFRQPYRPTHVAPSTLGNLRDLAAQSLVLGTQLRNAPTQLGNLLRHRHDFQRRLLRGRKILKLGIPLREGCVSTAPLAQRVDAFMAGDLDEIGFQFSWHAVRVAAEGADEARPDFRRDRIEPCGIALALYAAAAVDGEANESVVATHKCSEGITVSTLQIRDQFMIGGSLVGWRM